MDDDDLAFELQRLRRVLSSSTSMSGLPGPASEEDLAALTKAFAPLLLPAELITFLRIMAGSATHRVLLRSPGLLAPLQIVEETLQRRKVASDNLLPWCSGWIVIGAMDWGFIAVVAEDQPRRRSAVLDLSYGNQADIVRAASLTALVAASADAWSEGLNEESATTPEEVRRMLPISDDLLRRRSNDYPSEVGLTAGDQFGHWPNAWPRSWPPPVPGWEARHYPPVPLAEALAQRGGHNIVNVTIRAVVGRRVHVSDYSTDTWLDVPAGLAVGHSLTSGASVRVSVIHRTRYPGADDDIDPPAALQVTGIHEP